MKPLRPAVVRALQAELHAELAAVLANAKAAYDEATHAESKAENQYDTRSLEASYLAAGQAERVAALRRLVAFHDALDPDVEAAETPVGHGSLVALEDEQGALRWCFVAPDGGGRAVTVEGHVVRDGLGGHGGAQAPEDAPARLRNGCPRASRAS